MANVLLVGEEKSLWVTPSTYLSEAGHGVQAAEGVDGAMALLEAGVIDVVVTDLLPAGAGLDLLRRVRETKPLVQVILTVREPDFEAAAAAVRLRAFDLLSQPLSRERLLDAVARAAAVKARGEKQARLEEEGRLYREDLERIIDGRTAQLRHLVEDLNDVIFEVDQDGRITYVSPVIEQVLGYVPSELVGRPYAPLIHPDDLSSVMGAFADLVEGRLYPSEYRIQRKDGAFLWVRTSSRPVQGPDGRVIGIRGILTDVTERRRAEDETRRLNEVLEQRVRERTAQLEAVNEALRGSEERYRSLLRATDTGYVTIDAGGRVIEANEEYLRLTGRRRLEDIVGKPVLEWTAAYDRERNACEVRRCGQTGYVRNLAIDYVKPDGTIQPIELNASVLKQGAEERIVTLCRDITERKRTEAALRRAHEELEAKVKERTAQLRTLTGKLIGAEEAERERIVEILHEDLQQMLVALGYELETLRDIATRASRPAAADVAGHILDKAIQVTRSLSVDLRSPVLNDLELGKGVAWVAEDMKKQFGLAVSLDVAPGAEPATDTLRAFIIGSVRELLFNVAKHADTKTAELSMRLEGDRIKVEVKDRGKGFDISQDSPSGLGLFKIRERANYLGGEFHIVSSPRQGACATLVLPRC